jgi:hypothetical protein
VVSLHHGGRRSGDCPPTVEYKSRRREFCRRLWDRAPRSEATRNVRRRACESLLQAEEEVVEVVDDVDGRSACQSVRNNSIGELRNVKTYKDAVLIRKMSGSVVIAGHQCLSKLEQFATSFTYV